MLYNIAVILLVLVSLALIAAVLLQSGRSAGLSGAIAGGAEQIFGKKRGMDEFLARATAILGGAFFVIALMIAVLE